MLEKKASGLAFNYILFTFVKSTSHRQQNLNAFFPFFVFRPRSVRQRLQWGKKQRSCSKQSGMQSVERNLQALVALAATVAAAQPSSQRRWANQKNPNPLQHLPGTTCLYSEGFSGKIMQLGTITLIESCPHPFWVLVLLGSVGGLSLEDFVWRFEKWNIIGKELKLFCN